MRREKWGCCKTLLLTNSPRGAAAQPGQGRERMVRQFAGYIPANRAEKFREADREFAIAFFQIPPHDGRPWLSLTVPTDKACNGLSPSS